MTTKRSDDVSFVLSPSVNDADLQLTADELGLIEAMEEPVAKDVDVTLTGTFRHGMITVEQRTIPLNASGSGSETIQIFPPSVNVVVFTSSPAPCRFEFTVRINGKEQGRKGVSPAGKREHGFAFPFSEFGL
jgi:hypothetical protein